MYEVKITDYKWKLSVFKQGNLTICSKVKI